MRSLATRALEDEQMDAPDLDPALYAAILSDLAKVNRWTLAARPTLDFLARALGARRAFRLLDVGFGDGDMLRAIARWAHRRGIAADLVGVDLNPRSAGIAAAATPPGMPIRYVTGDYRDHVPKPFDFIISSLVAHHMPHDELIAFLRFMTAQAQVGWFVNDLHRHRFAYLGYPLLTRVMGWHRIVREDGQLSIARSFRPAEWRTIVAQAGLAPDSVAIARRFPFRLCVEQIR